MKYIIMAGGVYRKWQTPRHLIEINGEPLIARTIRMLQEEGVKNISISSNIPEYFVDFGVPVLVHDNDYDAAGYNDNTGHWCSAFYMTWEPTCYIFGDVAFSRAAIRTIVEYETDSIMLFGSKEPFAREYPKWYIEPFAFKVQDPELLRWTVAEVKRLESIGAFHRKPIAWEFWSVATKHDPNTINPEYVAINDYTCDIDNPEEIELVRSHIHEEAVMATKKTETKKPASKKEETKRTTKKAKPRDPQSVTYKGRMYSIMDRTEDKLCITDGTIHFWVKAKDVDAN